MSLPLFAAFMPATLLMALLSRYESGDKLNLPVKPAFDVPALLGKNIDQVNTILEKPGDDNKEPNALQLQESVTKWEKFFERDTTSLLVTYNIKTRKVTNFFISTKHGITPDYLPLLSLANVHQVDARITITPVPTITNPRLYNGVDVSVK